MDRTTTSPPDPAGGGALRAMRPDQPPLAGPLDPPAALASRTPLQEHAPAADTKAGVILTLLGLMFTLLARYGEKMAETLDGRNYERWVLVALLAVFSALALATTVQAFRTISPRFPRRRRAWRSSATSPGCPESSTWRGSRGRATSRRSTRS